MKVKVICDDCKHIFRVPETLYKSILYGDDIYLDNNCPRCDSQDIKTLKILKTETIVNKGQNANVPSVG